MIESRGNLISACYGPAFGFNGGPPGPGYAAGTWFGHISDINDTRLFRTASYSEMFRRQPAVYTVVDYRSLLTARLPLKVYRRTADGRREERDHPYARLLRSPNPRMDRNLFWRTLSADYDLHGEAVAAKVRPAPGAPPTELWPVRPWAFCIEVDGDTGVPIYVVTTASGRLELAPDDVVHWRSYNPDDVNRGMSPLEPLRATLENVAAARVAQASFWRRGARPGFTLQHPKTLSDAAAKRLRLQFDDVAGGADKAGATVVLEEGMQAKPLTLSASEAQYIEGLKFSREEVYAAYHAQPTALGDLEHATFANVTENLRSVYRDMMGAQLPVWEAGMAAQLCPDFDDEDLYGEFLMDEVLRAAFEVRADAISKAISAAQLTPNEGRALDNRPPLPGGDRLLVNSTLVPIEQAGEKAVTR